MKYEALMQRGEAQVKEGNTGSARVLFDLAQSAAPDAEARTAVRDRGRELGLYGEAPKKPSGSVRDWDGDPEEVKRRLEEAEPPSFKEAVGAYDDDETFLGDTPMTDGGEGTDASSD